MKLCHITPIPLLDDCLDERQTTHLVVAELIATDIQYAGWYTDALRRGDFVILDSAAFELGKANPELMVRTALDFNPSEVVLPDDMSSYQRTIEMSSEAAASLIAGGYTGQMMAVPHGTNLEEYLYCAAELMLIPGVTTLGIQEEVEDLFSIKRSSLARTLRQEYDSEIHFLGFLDDLSDIKDPIAQEVVRTADSAKLVVWGLNGTAVFPDSTVPEYPGRASVGGRMDYFDYAVSREIHVVRWNINAWDHFMAGGTREG